MEAGKLFLEKIRSYAGPNVKIMEVCGTHTHENFRLGIRSLLPSSISLISGPGCPVCVTPPDYIDEAMELGSRKDIAICSFGDLVRVPGSKGSLAALRADGADIRVVYSPIDAVDMAAAEPLRQFVFLSVGFETTVPAFCLAVQKAERLGLRNFSGLTSNKTMTNAYRLLKGSADAFLYPGHVSAITGMEVYHSLTKEGISGSVAGFTAPEILAAIASILGHLSEGRPFAVNCYKRVVAEEGNVPAKQIIEKMMESCDARWRGLGIIKDSGLRLREEYSAFDAEKKFGVSVKEAAEDTSCLCGRVLRGDCNPLACRHFGTDCTPESPIGACMVSAEGTCAAYYMYGGGQGIR